MTSLAPINVPAADKLRLLRRLDQYRRWESLDDKRQCIQCGEIISGRDIEIVGGTRALGPLRLQCPTENCAAIPMDWIIPNNPAAAGKEPRLQRAPGEFVENGASSRKGTKLAAGWLFRLFRQRIFRTGHHLPT